MYKIAKTLDAINIKGIDCHIGSQITELKPFEDSIKKLLELIDHLESLNIKIEHIDVGGGIGIQYSKETPPSFYEYSKTVKNIIGNRNLKVIFEPGRVLIGKAGILLTEVEYVKNSSDKNFLIVNAAMNDLMRPALYQAFHEIINISQSNSDKKNYSTNETIKINCTVKNTGEFEGKESFQPSKNLRKDLINSFNKLFEWHSSGKLKPHISNILPLEKANEALDLLRERKATGKVIVKVD